MKKKVDLKIKQAETNVFYFEYVDENEAPINLEGFLFKMDCRDQPGSGKQYFTLSSEDGTIYLDRSQNNKIWAIFPHRITSHLTFKNSMYDIVAYKEDRSEVCVVVGGNISLERTITEI
jgi:hypothetical protein